MLIERFKKQFGIECNHDPEMMAVVNKVIDRLTNPPQEELDYVRWVIENLFDLKSLDTKIRRYKYVYSRFIYVHYFRSTYGEKYSFMELSEKIGGHEHTKALYSYYTAKDLIETNDPRFNEMRNQFLEKMGLKVMNPEPQQENPIRTIERAPAEYSNKKWA